MQSSMSYYKILGISKTASSKEIKKSYRNLARKYHPDQAKDLSQSEAEERFKKINEAYSVLSDPVKRSNYDRFGRRGAQFGNSTNRYYSTYSRPKKSRRRRIDEKLESGENFSLVEFANELDVKVKNLEKILTTMIEKEMVQGKIIDGKFIHT